MSVFDASVVVDALVTTGASGAAARSVLSEVDVLQAPAILTAEVTSALRRMVARRELAQIRARGAIHQLSRLRQWRYPFEPFMTRVWALRDTMTVYDAWYVALAEELGTDLVTLDQRLAGSSGPRCPIVVVYPEGRSGH